MRILIIFFNSCVTALKNGNSNWNHFIIFKIYKDKNQNIKFRIKFT